MLAPFRPDSLADVVDLAPYGLALGHATDADGATGLTVLRGIDAPFRAAAALVGRASGTRELAAASPDHLVDRVDAILLTGGSAYGLDAAAGVMRWMEERGRGFPVGAGVVPIVPAAVLFDLAPLGRFDARPTAAMAYDACDRATTLAAEQGSVGAGTGATVGKALGGARAMKGGLGCAEAVGGGVRAVAIAVANAFGDVRDGDGRILAGARAEDGSFADATRVLASPAPSASRFAAASAPAAGSGDDAPDASDVPPRPYTQPAPGQPALQNTTLAVVAVDVPLGRQALAQVARAASAALFRRITPCGTSFDGDVVFAVCPHHGAEADPAAAFRAEVLAAEALGAAIERGVRRAVGRDGVPGLADPA
jgi:L-aminopeptidase/D-esterase-like protein